MDRFAFLIEDTSYVHRTPKPQHPTINPQTSEVRIYLCPVTSPQVYFSVQESRGVDGAGLGLGRRQSQTLECYKTSNVLLQTGQIVKLQKKLIHHSHTNLLILAYPNKMVLKYKSKPGLKTSLKFINLLPLSIDFFLKIFYANILRYTQVKVYYYCLQSFSLFTFYIHTYMIYTYKKYIE